MSERMLRRHFKPQDSRSAPASPWGRTRDAIVERCPELERQCPEAVDLDTEMIGSLHDQVNGRASELAGWRGSEDYFRKQLRGVLHPFTSEDIAEKTVKAPADVVAYFRPAILRIARTAPEALLALVAEVATILGFTLAPLGNEAAAADIDIALDFSDDAHALGSSVARDAKDGHLDEDHRESLRRVKARLAVLETRLEVAPRVAAQRQVQAERRR